MGKLHPSGGFMSRGKSVSDAWREGGFSNARAKSLIPSNNYNITINATVSGCLNHLFFEVVSFEVDPKPSEEEYEQIEQYIHDLDEEI